MQNVTFKTPRSITNSSHITANLYELNKLTKYLSWFPFMLHLTGVVSQLGCLRYRHVAPGFLLMGSVVYICKGWLCNRHD